MAGTGTVFEEHQFRAQSFALGVLMAVTFCWPQAVAQQDNKYDDPAGQAAKILNDSLGSIGPDYRGQRQTMSDPFSKYVMFLAKGLKDEAAVLVPQVCAEWKARSPNQPWTGEFSISGFNVSLDKLCGIEKK